MPNLDSLNIPAAFSTHLKTNEQIKHWAYGIKQSTGLLLIISLLAAVFFIFLFIGVLGFRYDPEKNPFGFLPMAIVMALVMIPLISLTRKEYIIAVTDQRLLIIHIKKGMFSNSVANARQLDFAEYDFQNLPPVEISIGSLKSSVKINDINKPFSAKFPNLLKGNKEQIEAIAEILNEY